MIQAKNYKKLKDKYGLLSSWALWNPPTDTPKSNTGDLSIFDTPNLLSLLNPNYVFVGLNVSDTHGKDGINEQHLWSNFHSNYKHQNDYKLRHALMNTKFWGSYMTDAIKRYPQVNSKKVIAFLEQNPHIVKQNIEDFKYEMSLLQDKRKPILIAMGNATYKILKGHLSNEFQIVKIMHYSNMIGKENYKKFVLETLKDI